MGHRRGGGKLKRCILTWMESQKLSASTAKRTRSMDILVPKGETSKSRGVRRRKLVTIPCPPSCCVACSKSLGPPTTYIGSTWKPLGSNQQLTNPCLTWRQGGSITEEYAHFVLAPFVLLTGLGCDNDWSYGPGSVLIVQGDGLCVHSASA